MLSVVSNFNYLHPVATLKKEINHILSIDLGLYKYPILEIDASKISCKRRKIATTKAKFELKLFNYYLILNRNVQLPIELI
jgi:hypothetical protein